MPTSTGVGLKTFTTPKIRVTKKSIYINLQVLKNFKNIPKSYRGEEGGAPLPPNLLFILNSKNTNLNRK